MGFQLRKDPKMIEKYRKVVTGWFTFDDISPKSPGFQLLGIFLEVSLN